MSDKEFKDINCMNCIKNYKWINNEWIDMNICKKCKLSINCKDMDFSRENCHKVKIKG